MNAKGKIELILKTVEFFYASLTFNEEKNMPLAFNIFVPSEEGHWMELLLSYEGKLLKKEKIDFL